MELQRTTTYPEATGSLSGSNITRIRDGSGNSPAAGWAQPKNGQIAEDLTILLFMLEIEQQIALS